MQLPTLPQTDWSKYLRLQGITHPNCSFPTFSQISAAQQNLIGNGDRYYYLTDAQKASFLDTTGKLDPTGISTDRLTLQEVEEDTNLQFNPEPTSNTTSFLGTATVAIKNGDFISDRLTFGLHKGRTGLLDARQNVTRDSLHIGFGKRGGFAHIDGFGTYTDPVGLFGHLHEFLKHRLTHTHTDPFKIGRKLGGSVTEYSC